jgi:hypothetical protein
MCAFSSDGKAESGVGYAGRMSPRRGGRTETGELSECCSKKTGRRNGRERASHMRRWKVNSPVFHGTGMQRPNERDRRRLPVGRAFRTASGRVGQTKKESVMLGVSHSFKASGFFVLRRSLTSEIAKVRRERQTVFWEKCDFREKRISAQSLGMHSRILLHEGIARVTLKPQPLFP